MRKSFRRHLNFTGRKRIKKAGPRKEVIISLEEVEHKIVSFDMALDLSKHELPDEASIIVEVYYRTYYRRFDWGTVIHEQPSADRLIRDIEPEILKFNLVITDDSGLILARAKGIRPESVDQSEEESQKRSLIGFKSVSMDQVWRVNLEPDQKPVVEVNKDLKIKELLFDSANARALVFPAILREIALRYLTMKGAGQEDDWSETFLKFAASYTSDEMPAGYVTDDGDGTAQEWVEEFVQAFCVDKAILANFQREGSLGER